MSWFSWYKTFDACSAYDCGSLIVTDYVATSDWLFVDWFFVDCGEQNIANAVIILINSV